MEHSNNLGIELCTHVDPRMGRLDKSQFGGLLEHKIRFGKG